MIVPGCADDASVLKNKPSLACREMAGAVIRSMVQRCDAQGRDKLFELTAVWVCRVIGLCEQTLFLRSISAILNFGPKRASKDRQTLCSAWHAVLWTKARC
jgi:hypothetical protein